MEAAAKLITAVAAILGAIAWPAFFAVLVVAFRKELRTTASRVPAALDRLRKFKGPWFEGELGSVADNVAENGEITADQKRAAARLAVDAREIGAESLFWELDKLCLQFDTVRRTMPPGGARTHQMSRILAKMRALGPSTSSQVDVYKSSESAGRRLAAIAMMQMEPAIVDLNWLVERFRTDAPFIFYHAALALTNAANDRTGQARAEVLIAAKAALETVRKFSGVPDQGTLGILDALLSSHAG